MRIYGPGGGRRMSFGGMTLTPGVKLLLMANAVVFVLQILLRDNLPGRIGPLTAWLSFIPQKAITGLEVWRFFTYMFLHGGFFHLGMNMFILWMFGSQVEARWGRRMFLIYYVVCGLGGALTYGLFNLAGLSSFAPMLGASGAIFGILLAYGLTFPDSVILIFMIIPMKAKYAVMLYGLIALLSSAGGGEDGVAHLAHLGGMITGFIFLKLTIPSLNVGGNLGGGVGRDLNGAWRRWQTKRRMKVVPPQQKPGNGRTRPAADGNDTKGPQTEIDKILDKISHDGLQSLTDEEQEILRRAGRK